MTTATEAMGVGNNQAATALSLGLDAVDLDQLITFVLYRKVTSPIDGAVFWVRGDIVSPTAYPAGQYPPALTLQVKGSLHHTTVNTQNQDESSSTNRMIFTTTEAVNNLAELDSQTIYLAECQQQRFTFSTRSGWYRQANLYHYSGDAVYPAFASQIIDRAEDLNLYEPVVNNSLPVWLTLNKLFPVYPAYLIPDNLTPPYAAVIIGEDDTTALQSAPVIDFSGTRWQLVKDSVRVVLYGVRAAQALDWVQLVLSYADDNPTVMGVMNSPVPRDSLRGQVEISALAQKKVINFEICYYQVKVEQIARQLIERATLSVLPQW